MRDNIRVKDKLFTVQDIITFYNLGKLKLGDVFAFEDKEEVSLDTNNTSKENK